MKRPPSPSARRSSRYRSRLDRVADGAQDLADLAAKEDQGDDRDDGDEGEDQRVLREALAVFVTMDEFHDLEIDRRHVFLSWMSTHPQTRAAPMYEGGLPLSPETMVRGARSYLWDRTQPPVA